MAKHSQYFAEHRCSGDIAEVDRQLALVLSSLDDINARYFPEL